MAIIKTGGIFLVNKLNQILVGHPTRHAKDIWSIPKGKLDKGEDSLTGALRETWEEVNVDFRDRPFNYYKLEKQTFKNKRKKLTPYVILEIENDVDFKSFDLKCNSDVEPEKGGFPEMDDFKWIDLSEVEKTITLHHTQVACLPFIAQLLMVGRFRDPLEIIW